MTKVEELVAQALELDDEELEELLDRLQAHLGEPEISAEWWAEIEARSERLRSGETHAIPWSEVRARMFAKVNGNGH
jgi:hypothetical protein